MLRSMKTSPEDKIKRAIKIITLRFVMENLDFNSVDSPSRCSPCSFFFDKEVRRKATEHLSESLVWIHYAKSDFDSWQENWLLKN